MSPKTKKPPKQNEKKLPPAPPEPESDDSTSGTEAETGDAGDVEEENIRLSKSAVHEEYDQISETLQVKTKTGKRIKVKKWKSSCKQLPIMKTIRAKDNVFHDVLDRVRTIVKKYSHSVNAKAELYELVQLLVVCYVVTRWWTDVDMMEKPPPYQQQEH